jgi:hypothetical protein
MIGATAGEEQQLPNMGIEQDRPETHSKGLGSGISRPPAECGIFADCDRQNTRHHHLEHRMPDAVRIAAIRNCFGEPQANTMLALRLGDGQKS